jgi:DNA mismatch endonuclease (patch repair protein)
MIFTRKKVVVFVDGCFWHGCRLCHNIQRDCNRFWRDKIRGNVERDRRTTLALRRRGWKVVRVWEHDLRRRSDLARTTTRLVKVLAGEPKR